MAADAEAFGGEAGGLLRLLILAPPEEARGPMPRIVRMLADALVRAGCTVTTTAWGSGSLPAPLLRRVLESLHDVLQARRLIAAERPDLVLVQTAHDWKCVSRDVALAAAVGRRGRPLVLQFHGSRADRVVAPGSRLFKLATALLLRLTDGVLVLSSEEQRDLQRFYPRGEYFMVSNPFEAPAGLGAVDRVRPGETQVVLFAARLLVDKGVLDTIDALAIVRRSLPCRLVVVGDGPAAELVERRIRENNLGDEVTLTGRLDVAGMVEAYREADVYVLPTYHDEGFPTSIAEAMSAGLPIVATSKRGIGDHLVDGVNALFVPPRDPASLARALDRALTDPELRQRMAAANLAAVKDFAPDRVVVDYLHAFDTIKAK